MLASDVILEVRRTLVEAVGAFWGTPELLTLLNRAENNFALKTKIFSNLDSSQSTTQGVITLDMPSDAMRVLKIMINVPSGSNQNWLALAPSNLEKVSQEDPNFPSVETTTQATPTRYWIFNNKIYLYPCPDKAYEVIIYHSSKQPIVLTATTDTINTPDELADYIIDYMLWKAFIKEREQDLAMEHKQGYMEGVAEGRKWLKKLSGDQRFKLDIESPNQFGTGPTSGINPFGI